MTTTCHLDNVLSKPNLATGVARTGRIFRVIGSDLLFNRTRVDMVRAMHDVIARISAAGRAAWPEIVPTAELAARIALPAADPAHDAELNLASAHALRA